VPKEKIFWSRSRLVVVELMDSLERVRGVENTSPIAVQYDFGNLREAQIARPPRLIWKNQGGLALEQVNSPPIVVTLEDGTTQSTTQTVGYRRNNYLLRIWENDPESAEILLDQLVTAAQLVDRNDRFVFERAPWQFITETEARWNENGRALIDVTVGVRVPIAKQPIGEVVDVIVRGSKFRAGIENPANEPLDQYDYDVDRISPDSWPG
jgi:hypothetical protein